jgi:hypothetical protein
VTVLVEIRKPDRRPGMARPKASSHLGWGQLDTFGAFSARKFGAAKRILQANLRHPAGGNATALNCQPQYTALYIACETMPNLIGGTSVQLATARHSVRGHAPSLQSDPPCSCAKFVG